MSPGAPSVGIGLSVVDPIRDQRGRAFTGGPYEDEVNGFELLTDAYRRTDPHHDARFSVPGLWDKEAGRIVNNQSGDFLRMLDREFDALATTDVRLCPPHPEAEMAGRRFVLGPEPWSRTGACSRPRALRRRLRRPLQAHAPARHGVRQPRAGPARPPSEGIADTVRFGEIRRHCYGTHPSINPNGIVALRPRADFDAPHGRDQLG